MGKILTVCSGSGGVGKTTIALSIAIGAAKAGKKTILLDASGAARSCDLLLGLESVLTLDIQDVLRDQISMDAALYPVAQYPGLFLACSSLYDHTPVSELAGMILALHSLCDILVVDMPTGQYSLGRGIMRSGDERLFVTRPDNASIRSTERMMMRARASDAAINSLVINRVSREAIKRKTQYPQSTVENLLDTPAIACIPEDVSLSEEYSSRSAFKFHGSAWTALNGMTKTLLSSV